MAISNTTTLGMASPDAIISTINSDGLRPLIVAGPGPSLMTTAAVGLIMLLGILTFKMIAFETVLPGIPELKGVPFLGAVPLYFKLGAPQLLEKLVAAGPGGISYANLVKSTMISIHSPALAKEVSIYPEEIASRYALSLVDASPHPVSLVLTSRREGDPTITNMSPWWTLRRLIGLSLFNYVGPDVGHLRNALIREFNNSQSNAEKFNTIVEIATAHVKALTSDDSSGEVKDVKTVAENFAISLWGEILYANRSNHVDGRILSISKTLLSSAASPWSSVVYTVQLFLKLVTPGEPTRSEAKVQAKVDEVIEDNLKILNRYEHNNPDASPKAIRNISVNTGGGRDGPLSSFATEFTKLNLFGWFLPLVS